MNWADMIFYNGNLLTMDDGSPLANAAAVKQGEIIYVGNEQEALFYQGADTEVIDLEGSTLMPGFIESHIHPAIYAQTLLEIDCKPEAASSLKEILSKVRESADQTEEDQWIIGWGWDDSKLKEKRNPTRWDLDEAAPNHPVVLKRTCAHMAVANTRALELSGVTEETPNPQGGHIERDSEGRLTGLLQEKAQGLIAAPKYSLQEMAEGMRRAQKKFASWGITTVHDMSTQTDDLQLYQWLLNENELSVRIRPWLWAVDQNGFTGSLEEVLKVGIRSGFGNDKLKIQGLKFMLDGSVGGKTAAFSTPYIGTEETGILYNTVEEIMPLMKKGIKSGLRIAVHAIGDRAIETALHSFEEISRTEKINDMRNRVEHCIFPSREHLKMMKNLGLIAGSSLGFLYDIGDNYIDKLGKKRMKGAFPHQSMKQLGITAPANSDLPVCDANPWRGIYSLVTRKTSSGQVVDEEERISVWEALKSYTTDAAYSSFEEEQLGVLKKGAKADLIVIYENPLEIEPEELLSIRTKAVYADGKLIYSTQPSERVI
ncbi:amidohydrolase [Halobacillus massiliensis]|uniref:amidohydrolase n=1 Tax=Halobacillus massiliensis TaxID=1926286 RepID=UPI0015C494FC|nr:amidohydrolase [Halobacillus massiliensis]